MFPVEDMLRSAWLGSRPAVHRLLLLATPRASSSAKFSIKTAARSQTPYVKSLFSVGHLKNATNYLPIILKAKACTASSMSAEQEIFDEFDLISQQLEEVATIRDEIRPAVQQLEAHSRQLQSILLSIYSGREGAVADALTKSQAALPLLRQGFAALAAIVLRRQGEFYRFCDHWKYTAQTVTGQLALIHWLKTGKLLSHRELLEQLELTQEGFTIDLEDYLTGICNLVNELPRFVINRVTAGDYECPRKVAIFLNDLFAAFKKLNLRNDSLRKRFDGIKYDLKKVEEVVYDVQIRGLGKEDTSMGNV